jgi:hypothetical protein
VAAAVVLLGGGGAALVLRGSIPGLPGRTAATAAPATPAFTPADAPTTIAAPPTGVPADDGVVHVHDGPTGFTTPSGNIACTVSAGEARCDIKKQEWTERPPKPADCTLEFGDAIGVSGTGRGAFLCHGDTAFGAGPTLPYGEAVRVGGTICASRESGVECRIDATRHGFGVARAKYTLF